MFTGIVEELGSGASIPSTGRGGHLGPSTVLDDVTMGAVDSGGQRRVPHRGRLG